MRWREESSPRAVRAPRHAAQPRASQSPHAAARALLAGACAPLAQLQQPRCRPPGWCAARLDRLFMCLQPDRRRRGTAQGAAAPRRSGARAVPHPPCRETKNRRRGQPAARGGARSKGARGRRPLPQTWRDLVPYLGGCAGGRGVGGGRAGRPRSDGQPAQQKKQWGGQGAFYTSALETLRCADPNSKPAQCARSWGKCRCPYKSGALCG